MNLADVFQFAKGYSSVFACLALTKSFNSRELCSGDVLLNFNTSIFSGLHLMLINLEKFALLENVQSEIREFMDVSVKLHKNKSKKKIKDQIVSKWDDLEKRLPVWDDRIIAEFGKINFITLSKSTHLNPEKLSKGVETFFREDSWDNLSELQRGDISDGCKCIALQAWTPAAMITMRVIEECLRFYYRKTTGNDGSGKVWGNLLHKLKEVPNSDKNLLSYFDYLKEIRNKLQHPDARITQHEAETIFLQAIELLSQIHT